MVVMVESEDITGHLNVLSKLNMNSPHSEASGIGSPNRGAASARYTGSRLYAEYLRREGRDGGSARVGSLKGHERGRASGSGGGTSKRSDSLVGGRVGGRAVDGVADRTSEQGEQELNFREALQEV